MAETPEPPGQEFEAFWGAFTKRVAAVECSEHEYKLVASALADAKNLGQSTLFDRCPHVPTNHLPYFKPEPNAFLIELKNKDRRSHKEWEYLNTAGVWLEIAVAAWTFSQTLTKVEDVSKLLALTLSAIKASLEILSMRGQYFKDIVERGTEMARQQAFLVEQTHDAVHSEAHRTLPEAFFSRLEIEAAKELARVMLSQKAYKDKGQGKNAGPSEK